MSFEFHEIIPYMANGINIGLINHALRFTALGQLLNHTKYPKPLTVLQTYSSSPKLIQWYFRKLIQNDYQKIILDAFVSASNILKKHHLFNDANTYLFITSHSPIGIKNILLDLQNVKILNQRNYDLITSHPHTLILMDSVYLLQKDHLLTQENFEVVAKHPNSDNCAQALLCLNNENLLNEKNRSALALHEYPMACAYAMVSLKRANIFNEENCSIILSHHLPLELVSIFKLFHEANLLTKKNRNILATHPFIKELGSLLHFLKQANVLSPNILNTLILPTHVILLSLEARYMVWNKILHHQVTEAQLLRLLAIATQTNPMPALVHEADQMIGRHRIFNNSQSAHTASVHHSVSESAIKLKRTYQKKLNIKEQIKQLQLLIHHLSEDQGPREGFKIQAAKRCLTRITSIHYNFIDSSDVSTTELLALSYLAIHDDNKRIGSLDDALILFIEGLYEIQRGYNLNPEGLDKGGEDRPICAAGTFNKIMEKLNGIHHDVEVYYITQEGANVKFPILAQNHAMGYLRTIASAKSARAYQTCKALIDELKEEGSLEPIWDKLEDNVAIEMWDEFKMAYSNNPQHHQFVGLIESGIYVSIPDNLSLIEEQLNSSSGYIAYQKEQSLLQKHSIWKRQNQNEHCTSAHNTVCLKNAI